MEDDDNGTDGLSEVIAPLNAAQWRTVAHGGRRAVLGIRG